jgi:nucleotidyltransferase/DNA polymerase involved in DNA repair
LDGQCPSRGCNLNFKFMRPRIIVHLDADAFFVAVEQATDPKLRGKAVAVGGEKRGIIASASYEARKFGVYTPMPTVQARKLCPKLIVISGDYERYEQFSNWMFSYAYDFTPDVEQTSIDEGYFDLSGAQKSPREIAETIRKAISQRLKISVSEGIGANKLVSSIASKLLKPAAFGEVPPGKEREFLNPLGNKWLPGVGPKTSARLNGAGLARIEHIAATPLEMLELLMGNQAASLRQFAHGIDERPLVPVREPAKSFGQQETFATDLTDEEYIEAKLRRMADNLFAKVREESKSIRTLTVRVRYNDMAEDQVSESLLEPTDLETEIYGRLHGMLRAAWKRRVSLRLDGDAGGYRTITPSQCAKDVLTVGAVYAITPAYSNAASVILASFSSIGPTTDGRIKPEVVAAGTLSSSITSNNPYGFPGLVTPWWDSTIPTVTYDYAWVSGTSFSCPAVASGLGLILQERNIIQPTWQGNGFPVLSSTLRALAVHAADQAGTNAGPSYTFGYGLFDAQNAVNLLIADAVTATNPAAGFKPYIKEVDLPAGAYIQYNIYATNSSSPLKVTLAWTDPQGPAQATNVLNDPTPRLVNDLDIRIYPPGTTTFSPNASTTYKPWILNPDLTNLTVSARSAAATTGDDTRNNLEQVVVSSPLTGTNYIVRITYKGTLKDNAGHTANDQWASLIMSGNLSTALPFIITAFIPQPNGDFIITWNAVVGGEYIIQTSTDLITWTDESGDINANLENMSELITPSGPYTYYRIKRIY